MMNSANPATMNNSTHAHYLLGFSPQVRGGASNPVPPLLAQLRIEKLCTSGVVAWYRTIERREFEGADAQRNLADLNWLTPRVLAHESVVSKLSELFAFYPARFGCLFSSTELLMRYAAAHEHTLREFFASADQRQEWGIKFTVDLEKAIQAAAVQELVSENGEKSGLNYLKLKQLQRTLRHPVLQQLHAVCDSRIAILRERFGNVVVRPNRTLAQPDRETLLANVAVWVDRKCSREAVELCDQWNSEEETQGIATTLSGPWPAYSFCPSLGAA